MRNILCIDVSGKDILDSNFAICLTVNDRYCYGYRLEKQVQAILKRGYGSGKYNLEIKKNYINLKIRLYSAIVSLLLKYVSSRFQLEDYLILMCNDFDGHFNDILQFLQSKTNLRDIVRNTVLHRHSHDSLIQTAAKALAKGKTAGIIKLDINLGELEALIRKKHLKK
jgi:hypothetical protein